MKISDNIHLAVLSEISIHTSWVIAEGVMQDNKWVVFQTGCIGLYGVMHDRVFLIRADINGFVCVTFRSYFS